MPDQHDLTTRTKLESAEGDYLSGKITYAELSAKYELPLYVIARFAKERGWVQKRKAARGGGEPALFDITKLISSSNALEAIIETALCQTSARADSSGDIDTKTLKDLASALKEAINIKQNLMLLPMVTEQKQLEIQQKKAPPILQSEKEIVVTLENGTERFCV